MSIQNIPATYEEYERLYPQLVEATFSALQENIARASNNAVRLTPESVTETLRETLSNNAFENLLNQVTLKLVPFQSPRADSPQHFVENQNQVQNANANVKLEATPWANFDLSDTFRQINTLHLPEDIASLANQQKEQENELANENKLQNKLQAEPSLTPQFKHTKALEEKLRQVAKLAVEKRLTNIPRLVR